MCVSHAVVMHVDTWFLWCGIPDTEHYLTVEDTHGRQQREHGGEATTQEHPILDSYWKAQQWDPS